MTFSDRIRMLTVPILPLLVVGGVGLFAYSTWSAPDDAPAKKAATATIFDGDPLLPQIQREIDEIVTRDGFIMASPKSDIETYIMPLTTPWIVHCGIGVSLALGNPPIEFWLFAGGIIDKSACRLLAPKVALRLRNKLDGK